MEPIGSVTSSQQTPDVDVKPMIQSDAGVDRVVDVGKAWDMAHSAKEERDKAIEYREDPYYKSNSFLDWEAQHKDRVADQIETWTGILHDHPVSEKYKEAHPGVSLDARSLTLLKQDIDIKEMEIAFINENGIDRLSSLEDIYQGIRLGNDRVFSAGSISLSEKGWVDRDTSEEWKRLTSSDSTTVKDLMDFFKTAANTFVIEPKQNTIAISKVILDDVSSGRASQ